MTRHRPLGLPYLFLLAGLLLGAGNRPAAGQGALPAADTVVPTALLSGLETEQQALLGLEAGVQAVLAACRQADPGPRHEALTRAAAALHPLIPTGQAALRAALATTLKNLAPDQDPTVVAVLDEQQRWEQQLAALTAASQRLSRELDALRLLRRALADPQKQLENLLLAESLFADLVRQGDSPRAARFAAATAQALSRYPPPLHVVDRVGLEYDLVGRDAAAYVSRRPIPAALFARFAAAEPGQARPAGGTGDAPATRVTWREAGAFCAWLRRQTELPVTLPDIALLEASPPTPETALWTHTPWNGSDAFERDMETRFGVEFYTVWDPGRRVFPGNPGHEVPSARHPALGFRVALPAAAVQRQRLAEMRRQLNLPPATATEETAP